ncbi:MAG: class I SAM-dependent methyltransferase [Pseudorhodoplanes sp.]|nr:class I SAM-dependent methyltransferase [Pseudorhodoplanes sp.]
MTRCLICWSGRLERVLDLGRQPVSSHFARSPDATTRLYTLALAVCRGCGIVQLMQPVPHGDLVPPFDWITYREPETHLDRVVAHARTLEGLHRGSAVVGLSVKDATTLDRFRNAGFTHVRSIDAQAELGAGKADAGVESIQALFTPERAQAIAERHGPADLVIARHVAEHAERPHEFMAALGMLLAPDGYLIVEVPDCRANLQRQDYTMIWEEHVLYFTPETLPQTLAAAGCVPVAADIHPFPFEDVIVLYARKDVARSHSWDPQSVLRNIALATAYGAAFPDWTTRHRALLERFTADGRRLAAYGAGHLTAAFINFHGLADYFACVIDDTAQKQGLFLPGCNLPIAARERLLAGDIGHCLLGLAPQIEDKVIANNAEFIARGGRFHSMFTDSPRSIRNLVAV